MTYILGFTILYLIPAGFAYLFWTAVARLAGYWIGRDVMLRFIPNPTHVAHTEKLLGTRTRPKPKESTFLALLSEYDKRGRNH